MSGFKYLDVNSNNDEATSAELKIKAKKKKAESELKKNITVLSQAFRTETSFFKNVPIEINKHIMSFTVNSNYGSEAAVNTIFDSHFRLTK